MRSKLGQIVDSSPTYPALEHELRFVVRKRRPRVTPTYMEAERKHFNTTTQKMSQHAMSKIKVILRQRDLSSQKQPIHEADI